MRLQQQRQAALSKPAGPDPKALIKLLHAARNSGNLNISDKGLEAIPPDVFHLIDMQPPQAVKETIGAFGSESHGWWEVEDLKTLNASHNSIADLPSDVALLTALALLDLSHNRLQALPDELHSLPELRSLDVSHNALRCLPSAGAGGYAALARLRCGGNRLQALPADLSAARALADLSLPDNEISALPDLSGCRGLTSLDASGNRISALPRLPPSLTALDCARNRLTALLPDLGDSCPKLVRFDARANALPALPASLGRCGALAEIFCGANPLSAAGAVPSELSGCSALRTADFSGASLASFPPALCGLSLTALDLSNNDIRDLPLELGGMATLRRLALEGNPIKSIRQSLLQGPAAALLAHLAGKLPEALDRSGARGAGARSGNVFGGDEAAAADMAARHAALGAASRGGGALALARCGLRAVPEAAWEAVLAGVRELDLSGNPDLFLSPSLDAPRMDSAAQSLRALSLAGTGLKAWPLGASGAPLALARLDCSGNPGLAPLPRGLLTRLARLQALDLSGAGSDPFGGLGPRGIEDLQELRELRLARCALRALPSGVCALRRLTLLDCAGNRIADLPPAVAGLTQLAHLDVTDNDLTALPAELGAMAGTLRALLVEGNALRNVRRAVLERGTPAVLAYLADKMPPAGGVDDVAAR